LSASNLRSARRLKPIAALRALTIATKIQSKARSVTGCFGQAKAIDDIANGKAKTVCENRTKLA
jgi:hypothetical protein